MSNDAKAACPSISNTVSKLSAHKSKNPKKKRRKLNKTEISEGTSQKNHSFQRTPNYFFAVQIDNPKIKGVMQAVQDHIVDQNKDLNRVVVNNKLAHLTAGLLYLPDKDSVQRAVTKFRECESKVQDILSQKNFNLKLEGIGHFGEEVVFAKVYPDENEGSLRKLAEFLAAEFIDFKSSSPFKYTPHLTLMKLSKIQKNKHLRKKVRRIDKAFFQHVADIDFGVQKVRSLQLLSMGKRKDKKGYYHCESEIIFGADKDAGPKSCEEKYAEYLTSYIFASANCGCKQNVEEISSVQVQPNNERTVGDVAEATVVSAMDEALREICSADGKHD